MMDDQHYRMGDVPPSFDFWGVDYQTEGVDVNLLADAFFGSNESDDVDVDVDDFGDYLEPGDDVTRQIKEEEENNVYASFPAENNVSSTSYITQVEQEPSGVASFSVQNFQNFGSTSAVQNNDVSLAGQGFGSFGGGGGDAVVNGSNSLLMAALNAAAATTGGTGPGNPLVLNSQHFLYGASSGSENTTMLHNPFLTLVPGMPAMDRARFVEAAFKSRQVGRRRVMSEDQAERRRERNRLLAKKTRERKKNHISELQDEVIALQRANAQLKAIVRDELDDLHSQKVLESCDAMDKVPESVWEACGTDKDNLAEEDVAMVASIQKSQTAFVITDPSFDDNPIIFVSPDFLKLTGYTREEVVGRNCRFLQGTGTCPNKINQIRKALATGDDIGITLINYKADGTPFWNRLFIAAVRDINDQIVNYMGVTVQVARPEPGDPEYEKELPS